MAEKKKIQKTFERAKNWSVTNVRYNM